MSNDIDYIDIDDVRWTKTSRYTEMRERAEAAEVKLVEAQEELKQWHEGNTECCKQRHEAQCARVELEAEVERLRANTCDTKAFRDEEARAEKAEAKLAESHPAADCEAIAWKEVERLRGALNAKCDEYKMHDPGFCNSGACDLARAVLTPRLSTEEGK